VREAHRESVTVALKELEPYVQARLGGNRRPETTGNFVAALFEHDSARPVNGYAAPQLHTHAVVFNLTETADGDVRPLQPRELYRTQQYATAVYRSELAARLTALGYEVERGRSGQPEIAGYSREYLDASSPRRQQIEAYLTKTDRAGAAAAQIAAHHTRDAKLDVSHEEMQQRHREVAEEFGNQPAKVVAAVEHERANRLEHEREPAVVARQSVTFARDRNLEREAVVEERAILRDALQRWRSCSRRSGRYSVRAQCSAPRLPFYSASCWLSFRWPNGDEFRSRVRMRPVGSSSGLRCSSALPPFCCSG
jgi:hypothetical protein